MMLSHHIVYEKKDAQQIMLQNGNPHKNIVQSHYKFKGTMVFDILPVHYKQDLLFWSFVMWLQEQFNDTYLYYHL